MDSQAHANETDPVLSRLTLMKLLEPDAQALYRLGALTALVGRPHIGQREPARPGSFEATS